MSPDQPIFRAIADPTRRAIIAMLAEGDKSVSDVASAFDITRPAVAKHLSILRAAELVRSHRRGRETLNALQPDRLKVISDWLAHYSAFWDDKLSKLKTAVEGEHDGH